MSVIFSSYFRLPRFISLPPLHPPPSFPVHILSSCLHPLKLVSYDMSQPFCVPIVSTARRLSSIGVPGIFGVSSSTFR